MSQVKHIRLFSFKTCNCRGRSFLSVFCNCNSELSVHLYSGVNSMSTRLSISNCLFSISFAQFQAMVHEYKQIAERSFATPCSLQIKAMNRIKMTSTIMHDYGTMDWIDEQNRKAVFFQTYELSGFSLETFNSATYIEVIIAPVDKQAAP